MYSTEGRTGDGRQLFQGVCDVLDRVGFRMRDGGLGLMVEPTPEGVRVGWRPRRTPLYPASGLGAVGDRGARGAPDGGYGPGINAAMVVAVAAVLDQAGYRVRAQDFELLVIADADADADTDTDTDTDT